MQRRSGHLMQEVVAYENWLTGVFWEEIPTHLKFIACNFQVTICLVPKLLLYPENLWYIQGTQRWDYVTVASNRFKTMKYLKCHPKSGRSRLREVVAHEDSIVLRFYRCVFFISAILNGQLIIMLVHLYIGQLILNIKPLHVLLFCNESITFNSYNFNLNLPNLIVSTVHVCSWIENKNKSYLTPILH